MDALKGVTVSQVHCALNFHEINKNFPKIHSSQGKSCKCPCCANDNCGGGRPQSILVAPAAHRCAQCSGTASCACPCCAATADDRKRCGTTPTAVRPHPEQQRRDRKYGGARRRWCNREIFTSARPLLESGTLRNVLASDWAQSGFDAGAQVTSIAQTQSF